jgi:hypothetical protein
MKSIAEHEKSYTIIQTNSVSFLGGRMGGFIFLRIPPNFPEAFYIEKEGKRSTNVINSQFLLKITLFY